MKYVDMHCDSIAVMYMKKQELYSNDLHVDIQKMIKGECLLQNFAVFTFIRKQDSSFTYNVIDYFHEQVDKYKDYIRPVYHYSDIEENAKNGYINAMLTLEDGSVVDNDINNLNRFYNLGVRMITLTWNFENGIGYPNFSPEIKGSNLRTINTKDGLTPFGIEYVKKCNELGIIVDVSHLSDAGFYDVIKYCDGPFVASHSNARSVCSVARNLTDEMIVELAKKGGVTGLNYCSSFITDDDQNYTSIEDMVKHIRHIVNVGGIDCVGLGSDFDGIESKLEIENCGGMQKLYEALKKYYSDDEIEKIFYKNVLRVYKEVIK